jgi:hypothetical protein
LPFPSNLLRSLLVLLSSALFVGCSGADSDESQSDELDASNVDGGSAGERPGSGLFPQLSLTLEGDGHGQVTSNPAGIDCGALCSAWLEVDSTVTLIATPAEDSEFAGWGMACVGSESSCELDVEVDTRVNARFMLKRYPVTFVHGGDGTGEVAIEILEGPECTGEPCVYALGTRLKLLATPSVDSHFSGWNGLPCGIDAACELQVTGELNIEVLFAKQERGLAVVLDGNGKGRVHSEPIAIDCPDSCASNWKIGSPILLTAEPDEATSRFSGWSGSVCTGEELTCELSLNETSEVHANFALLSRPLDVTIAGNGTGLVTAKIVHDEQEEDEEIIRCGQGEEDCEEILDHGTQVELTLTPTTGSGFSWGGACAGQETVTCTLTMSEAREVTATFLLQPRALNVTLAGNGVGRVNGLVGDQRVITCGDGGSDCIETVSHGSTIALTAVSTASSVFAGWGGACSGTAACNVSMTELRSVTATFTLRTYAVAVAKTGNGTGTVSGTGIDCGGDCSESYNHGANVTLSATPSATSTFTGWSGACSGSAACTVTVSQALSVSANFALRTYPLSINKGGSGSGSVSGSGINCGSDCGETLNHGTSVTLSATASADSDFTGWGGACSGSAACTVSMTQARDVTATFTLKTYALSVARSGTGSGSIAGTGITCGADCAETFNHGTNVTLTAAADASSSFAGWSGACSGTATCTVSMTQVRSVTATFALLTPALNVSKAGAGSGTVQGPDISCGTDCAQSYNYDTDVTLTATADASSDFTGWSGACTGTGNCTVDMTQARTVTATFALRTYALAVSRAGNGAGSVTATGIDCGTDCSGTYNHGTNVTLSAAATGDSAFGGWSGACSGTGTCTVSMTQARSVTATFTLNSYALSVTKAGTGTGTVTGGDIACGATCSATFVSATTVTLTAAADASSTFTGWSGACSGTGSCTVSMTQTRAVTATFAVRSFALSVTKNGTGTGIVTGSGVDCGATCSASYNYGTDVTLSAASDASSVFTGWTGACSGTTPCTVDMTQARSVAATFTLRAFALTVAKSGTGAGAVTGGAIDCGATCNATLNYGATVTLSVTPDAGSTFAGWSGACSGTDTCTVTMTQARSVSAGFTLQTPLLTVTKPGTGAGTVAGSGIDCGPDCTANYNYGTSVTLSATPDVGSTFTSWGGACSGSGSCTVGMTQARGVSATFTLQTFALTVTKSGTGTGSVTGGPINCGSVCTATPNYGTTVVLTATPDASATFTGWSGACSGSGTCTVAMTQVRDVNAIFVRKTPALTVSRIGTGTGTISSAPAGINCGTTCNSNFDYDTNVTLTATPDASSTFGGWTGACTGSGACTVDMLQAQSVSATFVLRSYGLVVTRTGTGVGTVNSSPAGITCGTDCDQTYNHGASVTLTAVPSASSNFAGWSGTGAGECEGSGPCTVSMTQAQTISAAFTIKRVTLSVYVDEIYGGGVYGDGIDCDDTNPDDPGDCSETYDYGTVVDLGTFVVQYYEFLGWSGACTGTGECSVTMTEDLGVDASFARTAFGLQIGKGGTGSGTIVSTPAGINCGPTCSGEEVGFSPGSTVTLTATPAPGSTFMGWSSPCSGTGPCSMTLTNDDYVYVVFNLTPDP